MATCEVTVRGAGIFGLAVAWACLRRGARVQVIDPHGVARGASGGVVGALAPHVPENWNDKKAFQLDSLLMAETFWSDVAEAGGKDPGYLRSGRLQPLADAAAVDLARRRSETAAKLWRGKATWTVTPAPTRVEWTPPSPSGWLVHDTLTARLHPRAATNALAAAIRALGGTIREAGEETGIVVDATGHDGLRALSEDLGKPVGDGVKGQAAVFRFDARQMPQIYAGSVHIVPHADGTVAVGSTSERDWCDPRSTDSLLDEVIDKARTALPLLSGATVIERWAGVRPRARSKSPLLGPHPTRPGRFIANGGFKIGYGMAPKVGEVMADLILEGRDTIPPGFHTSAL